MTGDDDLAKLLPPTPLPRPDRRDAAIDAAMRNYDGIDASFPGIARPERSWIASNRPLVGALASLALVVSIGLPAWMNSDFAPRAVESSSPRREPTGNPRIAKPSPDAAAVADQSIAPAPIDGSADEAPQAAATPTPRGEAPPPPPATAEDRAAPQSEAAFAFAPAAPPPPPPPPPPPLPAPAAVVAAPSTARAAKDNDIVVTGARAMVDRETSARSAAGIASRRTASPQLQRCTVVDPRRDIEACRAVIERAVPKSARPFILDGVARAWRGDLDGAAAALDRAIARAPRSALAYYNRSLVLSQLGEARRADADKKRTIELDDRYRAAFD